MATTLLSSALFEDRIPSGSIEHPPNVGEALFVNLRCPCCGHLVELDVDPSAGNQTYVDDCPSCCRPIEVHLQAHDLAVDSIDGLAVH